MHSCCLDLGFNHIRAFIVIFVTLGELSTLVHPELLGGAKIQSLWKEIHAYDDDPL